jgi:hypothetical protein
VSFASPIHAFSVRRVNLANDKRAERVPQIMKSQRTQAGREAIPQTTPFAMARQESTFGTVG